MSLSGLYTCFESKFRGSTPHHPMLFLATWILQILLVLLTVAFFTLFERKVIALTHLRLGPNKTSFLGLLQPLLDAFKLLSKQSLISLRSNKYVYSAAPQLSLFLSLSFWLLIPSFSFVLSNSLSILSFLLIGSAIVFANLLAGWGSNSKYTFIGSLRSVAQSISYESVFTTLVILLTIYSCSYSFSAIYQSSSILILTLLPLWVFSTLAETHRAPFDFSERESELVSGYNTEYSGANFAFVFLGEYCSLLFSSGIIYYLFFSPSFSLLTPNNPFLFSVGTLFVSFFFILIRVTYCRFRYDYLIILAWKSLLPVTLSLLLVLLCIISLGILM